jgi:hypothetical protein
MADSLHGPSASAHHLRLITLDELLLKNAVDIARQDERQKASVELANERRASDRTALQLLQGDMNRRLELLNNEAERLKLARAEAVSRDVFAQFVSTNDKRWADSMAADSARYAAISRQIAYAAGVASAVGTILGFLMRFVLPALK